MDDNKQIAELLLRQTDAINRRERLIKSVENAIQLKYRTQIPELFSSMNEAMSSRFGELQLQNRSNGRLKIWNDEYNVQNDLYFVENNRVDETMVNNDILRDDTLAKGKDVDEEYAAACYDRKGLASKRKLKVR